MSNVQEQTKISKKKRYKSQFVDAFRSAKSVQIQPIIAILINIRKTAKTNPDWFEIGNYIALPMLLWWPFRISEEPCMGVRSGYERHTCQHLARVDFDATLCSPLRWPRKMQTKGGQ